MQTRGRKIVDVKIVTKTGFPVASYVSQIIHLHTTESSTTTTDKDADGDESTEENEASGSDDDDTSLKSVKSKKKIKKIRRRSRRKNKLKIPKTVLELGEDKTASFTKILALDDHVNRNLKFRITNEDVLVTVNFKCDHVTMKQLYFMKTFSTTHEFSNRMMDYFQLNTYKKGMAEFKLFQSDMVRISTQLKADTDRVKQEKAAVHTTLKKQKEEELADCVRRMREFKSFERNLAKKQKRYATCFVWTLNLPKTKCKCHTSKYRSRAWKNLNYRRIGSGLRPSIQRCLWIFEE